MANINIGGTVISFPNSSTSPNWAEPMIQFAQAVELALSTSVGPYDVSAQVYNMVANVNNNVDLPNLSFAPSQVRSAIISYSVYRDPDTAVSSNIVVESGTITVTYNEDGLVNEKWSLSRIFQGNASVSFSISDVGQVMFSSSSLGAGTHEGKITYYAKTLIKA